MSKQSEAKAAQGYRTELQNCGNCKHRVDKRTLPAWMERRNAANDGYRQYTLERDGQVSSRKCGIGDFAIGMTATCNKWEAT